MRRRRKIINQIIALRRDTKIKLITFSCVSKETEPECTVSNGIRVLELVEEARTMFNEKRIAVSIVFAFIFARWIKDYHVKMYFS